MANNTPVKNISDLFRFVTFRSPKQIDKRKKQYYFIHHPNPGGSTLLKELPSDIKEARSELQKRAKEYSAHKRLGEVQDIEDSMSTFSTWLQVHRNVLTVESVTEAINGVTTITDEQRLKLWDNIIYQAIERRSVPIRRACANLILADHFISIFKTEDIGTIAKEIIQTPCTPEPPAPELRHNLFLRRVANAKLVLHKAVSREKQWTTAAESTSESSDLNRGDFELRRFHMHVRAEMRVDKLMDVRRELNFGMSALGDASTDLETFSHSAERDRFISARSEHFLKSNPIRGVTFPLLSQLVNEKIAKEKRASAKLSDSTSPFTKTTPDNRAFVLSVDDFEGESEILMTIYLRKNPGYIDEEEYTLMLDGGREYKDSASEIVDTGDPRIITLRLFPEVDFDFKSIDSFELAVKLKFSSGDSMEFKAKGKPGKGATQGKGKPTRSAMTGGTSTASKELYGVNRLGIAVFRKVEQEVCCYVPGEVSRVENILAREYKERSTRSLLTSETTQEENSEVEVENQSDTASTSRNELNIEVAKVLESQTSIEVGAAAGVSGKYFGVDYTASGNFGTSYSTSSSNSDSEAKTYAQEITQSALERLLQKTTIKRTSHILQEFEEKNRHGFDNREGDQHVTGVYRWLDIIYTNRLINYGKRLMLEFLIPEPSRFYKQALKSAAESDATSGTSESQQMPLSLEEKGINSADDITVDNYPELGRYYNVTLTDPITPITIKYPVTLGPSDDPKSPESPERAEVSYQFNVNFMEFGIDLTKYKAKSVTVDYSFDYVFTRLYYGTYFIFKIKEKTYTHDFSKLEGTKKENAKTDSSKREDAKTKSTDSPETIVLNSDRSLKATVDINNVYTFGLDLNIMFEVTEQEQRNWQRTVYDDLARAYEEALDAYYSKLDTMEQKTEAAEEEQGSLSSSANRTLEKREIRRIAIEMLTQPFAIPVGEDFYNTAAPCGVQSVNQGTDWEIYSSHVKWFEQSMEWDAMAYLFYPYYWADRCDWIELSTLQDADDATFQAFLQSGMARVVVPVRQGFEEAVDYYLDTGDIWNGGGLVLDTDDDLYLSIDEELTEIEGVVEDEWQSRVPTSLTIVQGKSAYLEDEGLPCCDKLNADVDTLIRSHEGILGTSSSDSTGDETDADNG